MELKLTEIEVQKLNLRPGETLVVTLHSDEIGPEDMESLGAGFRHYFPNNKVAVLNVGSGNQIKMTVVADLPAESCGATPSSFCGDCSCGKKEAFEASKPQGE